MTEFFVPEADTTEQAEEVWQGTKKFVEEQRGAVKDRRIYSIKYKDHDGRGTHTVAVGDTVPRVGEPAVVILESDTESFDVYYICTPNRAVSPVMVGKHNVHSTQEFA